MLLTFRDLKIKLGNDFSSRVSIQTSTLSEFFQDRWFKNANRSENHGK